MIRLKCQFDKVTSGLANKWCCLQVGYSSPTQSGIMDDLGLSLAEVSNIGKNILIFHMLHFITFQSMLLLDSHISGYVAQCCNGVSLYQQ